MTHERQAHDGLDWQHVSSEPGPDLGLLQARFDWMRHPSGETTCKRLVLESPDWVNCVARTEDGRILLVEQHRFGTGSVTLEPPGGTVEPDESPLEAAQRELLEETGYGGGRWTALGAVEPNPAIHPHLCHHFLAEGIRAVGAPTPGPGEALRTLLVTEETLRDAVHAGRIRHALALTALTRVFDLFPRDVKR